jgi:hypothetical protein
MLCYYAAYYAEIVGNPVRVLGSDPKVACFRRRNQRLPLTNGVENNILTLLQERNQCSVCTFIQKPTTMKYFFILMKNLRKHSSASVFPLC